MKAREIPTDRDTEQIYRYIKIDLDVLYDDKISNFAKHLFGVFHFMDQDDRGCFASNGYLAAYFGCSEKKVSRGIQELKDEGYINVKFKKSKYRSIKVVREGNRFNYYMEDGVEKKVPSIEYAIKIQKERINSFYEKTNQKARWEPNEQTDKVNYPPECPTNLDILEDTIPPECPTNIIVNTKYSIIRNSSKEEVDESDGASSEAEKQTGYQYNLPLSKDNNTCDTNNTCAIEVKEDVEVEEKFESLPKIPRNGVVRLVYDLSEYWEKQGFKSSAKKYENYTKNIVKLLTNGNFFYDTGLGEKDKKYTKEDLFNAVDNRVNSYNLAIGDKKKEIKKLPLWLWLYNEKAKYSQFIIDLSGYEKKVVDKYPVLTEAIKKEYVKTILGSVSSKWTLYQEQDFIKSAKKMMEFIAVNRKNLRSHFTHPNEETMARWLIKSILASRNGVYEGIKTSFLRNDITFNSSLPSWLNNEAVLKG